MGQDAAQSAAVRGSNHGHNRSASHGLGLAFMHFTRSSVRHHLGNRFVVRQLVGGDLVRHFLLAFTFELVFPFALEFAFAESLGSQSTQSAARRTSNGGGHQRERRPSRFS